MSDVDGGAFLIDDGAHMTWSDLPILTVASFAVVMSSSKMNGDVDSVIRPVYTWLGLCNCWRLISSHV